MANIISDKFKTLDSKGRDFPLLKGDVKITLKNVHNGKTEVIEGHNAPTNALNAIFDGNYGGLLNYNNFANLYETWLGGVLVFASALDSSEPSNYGVPSSNTNAITAHAGRTPFTDQSDDITRGNPDSTGTVLTSSSTKLVWEWGTSAGNGTIAALGLTHSDTGSYGCGVNSVAQKSLDTFANVGAISKSYSLGDNANAPLAINGNLAYGFYMVSASVIDIFITPINNSKFKLQGGSLEPLAAYTTKITATVPTVSFTRQGQLYYHFDFTAGTLTIWRVPTEGGTTLLQDVISLSDGSVTSTSITVTGATLWAFRIYGGFFDTPIKAIVNNGFLYVYGYTDNSTRPNKMYKIEISTPANISEVDTSAFNEFYYPSSTWNGIQNERITTLGGLIIHDNFIINNDKTFGTNPKYLTYNNNIAFADYGSIISPCFGINVDYNIISVCKLYLATKYNLQAPVTKTSAQSLTVEYTLTEV